MRVLLTIHHHLDPNLGAPGATLTLGKALEGLGCTVEYYGFEKAFDLPTDSHWGVGHSVKFPWRAAGFLAKQASSFDAIDASTGDACYWLMRGRPGSTGPGAPALITRVHGLEHVVDRQQRADAKAGKQPLSWKYPIYHGGYRLWEVAQSLRRADRVIFLNDIDRQFAADNLGVVKEKSSVVAMGVADYFYAQAKPAVAGAAGAPLRLAFLSSWIPRKGSDVLTAAMKTVRAAGIPFELTLFGAGVPSETVLADFDESLRPSITVVPRFKHTELPSLLEGRDMLLFPSLAEGFSRALVEAMSCGLAPIATPVGGAPAVIRSGDNGILVPTGDAAALAQAVIDLARNPERLLAIRRQAQTDAAAYSWDSIARQTLAVYESACRRKAESAATAVSTSR